MSNILKLAREAGHRVGTDQTRKRSIAMEHARDKHELNALIVRHSLAHTELANLACGGNRARLRSVVEEMQAAGLIGEVHRDANKYNYTLEYVHSIMDYLNADSWSDQYRECIVVAVSNLKGGTGKTSTTIHLAASLALDLDLRPRVLIIDFDDQGSLSSYGLTSEDNQDNTITAVDIALQDYEENYLSELTKAGYTEEDVFSMAIIGTHIPNLHILPALSLDQRFDELYYSQPESERKTFISCFKDKVIEKLKPFYDVILIDTGPKSNPHNWSALEASNAVLIPVTPRTLDWDATSLFLRVFPEKVEQYCPSAGSNLKWMKIVPVNADLQHNRDTQLLLTMKKQVGSLVTSNCIQRTPAFEEANKKYITVFDLLKKDAATTPRQIDLATRSISNTYHEIKLELMGAFGGH